MIGTIYARESRATKTDGDRHTFASRLAMAEAGVLTIKEVGGWRTLR